MSYFQTHEEGGSEHVQYRPQSQALGLLTAERLMMTPFCFNLTHPPGTSTPELTTSSLWKIFTYGVMQSIPETVQVIYNL
jgi:hypothetical protein